MEERPKKRFYNVAECQSAVDSVIAELTPEFPDLKAPVTVSRFRKVLIGKFVNYGDPDYNRAKLLENARTILTKP